MKQKNKEKQDYHKYGLGSAVESSQTAAPNDDKNVQNNEQI